MIGRMKVIVGAFGIGLALYIVGSVIVLIAGDNDIEVLYKEYMGVIWLAMAAASYPLASRILDVDE